VGVEAGDGVSACKPKVTCFPLPLDLDATGGCGKLKLDKESVEVLDVWIEAGGARGFPLYGGKITGDGRPLVLSSLSGCGSLLMELKCLLALATASPSNWLALLENLPLARLHIHLVLLLEVLRSGHM